MRDVHLAQVNIARIKAPLESPEMAGFVARLDEINALADHSPGFVWRLQTDQGNATYLRPYDDDEAKKRLAHLAEHGPTPFAFSFKLSFAPDEAVLKATDWSSFEPCPAV